MTADKKQYNNIGKYVAYLKLFYDEMQEIFNSDPDVVIIDSLSELSNYKCSKNLSDQIKRLNVGPVINLNVHLYKNFYMISKDTIPKMMDEFTESQTFVLGESWEKKDESKDIEIIGLFKRNENCIFISRKKT